MSRPRRVISIPLPHRESVFVVAIVATCLLIAVFASYKAWKRARAAEQAPVVQIPNAQLIDRALNARVEKLLSAMTLDQKIGQLTQYSAGLMTGPNALHLDLDTLVGQGQIGSLFNVVGAKETNRYQHLAMEKSPLHIPLMFGDDVIHGDHTIFPVPLGLAASFDPDLVEKTARVAAEEASADGVRWVFSPMVDIARDARWGRITEGAGEDTFLGSALARAYVHGYQGGDLSRPDSVAACVKHFAAYGAPNAGREYNTVDMSELSLRQIYLPPYHAAVSAGAATVMSAFNPLNGVPATADPFTLTTILRDEWNFQGFVVSDFGAVRELINHGIADTGSEAAEKALTAGTDMDMMSDLYRTRLPPMVQAGELNEATVTEAARRILRVKLALGLFDHPYTDEKLPAYTATSPKRALARQAAEETIVLLKNGSTPVPFTGLTLPLRKETPRVALIGPLADSSLDMLGSWQASGNPADAVTLRTALLARCQTAKTQLLYAPGTAILTDSRDGFPAALQAAGNADVIVLALGESGAQMTGESASVTRLDLPGNQEELLEEVTRLGKPTVLVLFDGRPLAIKWAAAHVPAILEAWYPGIEAGNAVADILFGDTNPSGKITATFPRAVGQEPIFYNQLPTGRPAGDIDLTHPPVGDERYLSRYIDETNAPLYPFGFGLSYTQFSYGKLTLSQTKISAQKLMHPPTGRLFPPPKDVRVGVDVQNTGKVAGLEIAQLYVRNTGGMVEEPVRELRGFRRVSLQPGETKHLEFTLGADELAHYDLQMQRVVEPAKINVWVGGSSQAAQGAEFEITP